MSNKRKFNDLLQAASRVLPKQVSKRHKKKHPILSKIGNFLLGGLHTAARIAPAILPYLAANVPEGYSHQGNTKATLAAAHAASIPEYQTSAAPLALGLPPNMANFELRFSGARHKKYGGGLRVMCADMLDDITGSTQAQGDVLLDIPINPVYWGNTRIAQIAPLFERFNVNSCHLMYMPSCPATTAGSLVSYFDADAEDIVPTGRDGVTLALSTEGRGQGVVWQPFVSHFLPDPEAPDYYLSANGSDNRLTAPGRIRACVLGGPLPSSGSLGTWVVLYDLSFFKPTIDTVNMGIGSAFEGDGVTGMTGSLPYGTPGSFLPDTENTLIIDYQSNGSASCFWGFPTAVSIPYRYYVALNFVGTGLVSVTLNYDQCISVRAKQDIPNAAATSMLSLFAFETAVVAPSLNIGFRLALSATTVTGATIHVFRMPSGLANPRLKTLQEYEKSVDLLLDRVATLELNTPVPATTMLQSSGSVSCAALNLADTRRLHKK